MADINVPGVGAVDKRKALVIGGVVVLGGIVYYRHKQSGGGSTSTTATDTGTINPATGYPFNSPEDLNALALQSQSAGGGGGSGGSGGIVDTNGTNVPNETTSFVDNAHWERAAVDYLSNLGESPTAVSAALSKYLAGTPVHAGTERSYVDQAIAAMNQPPIAGANGYPPHIHVAEAPTTNTPGPVRSTRLATPHIRTLSHNRTLWRIGWNAIAGADHYDIHHLPSGTIVGTTRSLSWDIKHNGSYRIYAVPASGSKSHTYSSPSNIVHVTGV